MTMSNRGLTKLVEECGELVQVAAKKTAYAEGPHPDGAGDLNTRMEDEIADVLAACRFVVGEFGLNQTRIDERLLKKLTLFRVWHEDKSA